MTYAHGLDYDPGTAIAIVGMSGRFPGAGDVHELWRNLLVGTKGIRWLSDEELRSAGIDEELWSRPDYVRASADLDDIDLFDAAFYGITPSEAELMDPQHRVFLQCCSQALEDMACDPDRDGKLIGVFGGSGFSYYLLNNLLPNSALYESADKMQVAVANERDSLTSTVSYKLNLKGPSVAVQAFCSTSMVAVHFAVQSLLNCECDVALAGGVAITIPQRTGYICKEGGMLSPDGECRTFDADAGGRVIGDGVGVVGLKRLADALQDRDHIYAVVRGSSVNNDGTNKVGYLAPGLDGQAEVITEALAAAGVEPESIGYIEAHGAATPLGDAVELAAMNKAFRLGTDKRQFCAIGSLKPNIGHLDRASGVAGLIKTALILHHSKIPPSLNFTRASADVDLPNSPFYVNTSLADWPAGRQPRRAGVSSFGFGGTNVHVVLEEAPVCQPSDPASAAQLLVLSAKTASALKTMTRELAGHLRANPDIALADVAYTLQSMRPGYNHRRTVVCEGVDDAIEALESLDPNRVSSSDQSQRERPVTFIMRGRFDHGRGELAELYASEPTFRDVVNQCCAAAVSVTGRDPGTELGLHAQCDPAPDGAPVPQQAIETMAAFVAEYALARLLISRGVRPAALVGHGAGEFAAGCLSGIFPPEDALRLLAEALTIRVADERLSAAINDVSGLVLQVPQIPIQSAAVAVSDEQATDVAYWTGRTCAPLSPAADVEGMTPNAQTVLMEIGCTPRRKSPDGGHVESTPQVLAMLPAPGDPVPARTFLLHTLGDAWLAGVTIDWAAFYEREQRNRLSLPTYPFEGQSYWVDATRPRGKNPDIAQWFDAPRRQKRP